MQDSVAGPCLCASDKSVHNESRPLHRRSVVAILLSATMIVASGCTAITVSTSTSGPPPTTIVYFFAPVNPNGNYEVLIYGGIFGDGTPLIAQRMPAYDNASRPEGLDPSWVAFGINPTLVNGQVYNADFGFRSTTTGLYTYYDTVDWTQDNQAEILIK